MEDLNKQNPAKTLVDFVNSIPSTKDTKNNQLIKLSTIHVAQGLEFSWVFVAGLVERIFPDWHSLIPRSNQLIDNGGIEAERRLLYIELLSQWMNFIWLHVEKIQCKCEWKTLSIFFHARSSS